jgi:hypothetical protein
MEYEQLREAKTPEERQAALTEIEEAKKIPDLGMLQKKR